MNEINIEQLQEQEYITNETMLREDIFNCLLRKDKDQATELLASTLQNKTKFFATRFDERNEMFYYSEGIYKPEGRTYIKEYCRRILKQQYTEFLANRVCTKIETDNYIEQKDFLKRHYKTKIACTNGILDLETKQLEPFDLNKIFLLKIPVKYNPNATCEQINNFFKDTLPSEEDIQTMHEIFGFCLIGGYDINKIILFIGEGSNGKSQMLKLLRLFLGEGNYTAIPLQKFEDSDFKEAELFNKLANIGNEISDAPLKTTAKIKGLSGGDNISASVKFKNDRNFDNETKLLFSANKLPKTYDLSFAFFRRWVYINFPYCFLSEEEKQNTTEELKAKCKLRVPDIAKKISTEEELSGLLNLALDGLGRLMVKGDFTSSKSNEDIRQWWIRHSDSFMAFCWEQIENKADGVIYKEELRKKYQKYCKENKLPSEGDKHVHEVLTRQILAWDYQESEGERAWGGIAWKKSKEEITGTTP